MTIVTAIMATQSRKVIPIDKNALNPHLKEYNLRRKDLPSFMSVLKTLDMGKFPYYFH